MRKSLCVALLFLSAALVCSCAKSSNSASPNGHSGSGGGSGKFTVIAFTPDGELPSSVRFPAIQVQFSQPVVPLEKLGEPTDKSDIITITPPLKGRFRWYGTSLLAFDAEEAVIPQRTYTVKVNPATRSIHGEQISGTLEFSFHPEELYINSIIPGYASVLDGNYVDSGSVPMELARDIAVYFSAPVNSKHVAKFLRVKQTGLDDSAEKELGFTSEKIKDSDSAIRLTLQEQPDENSEVHVILPAKSSSDEGSYETSEDFELSFKTLRHFKVSYVDSDVHYLSAKYAKPVTVEFNAPLKNGSEAEFASHITTDLGTKITEANVEIRHNYVYIFNLPVDYESHYKLTIGDGVTDIYGRKLSAPYTTEIFVPGAASMASFKDYGMHMLEAAFEPKIAFSYQNVLAGSNYSVVPLTDSRGRQSRKSGRTYSIDLNTTPKNTLVVQTVPLAEFLDETDEGYRGAVKFGAEMNTYYYYRDWKSNEKERRESKVQNSQVVQVTDLGLTTRFGYNRAAVLVTRLSTGEPVSGAEVKARRVDTDSSVSAIVDGEFPVIASAKTDAAGLAVIEFPKGAIASFGNRQALYIEAITENDRAFYNPDINSMWRYDVSSVQSPRTAENLRRVTFMFTDRGLYKPGEKVSFRGIDRVLTLGEYEPYTGSFTIELTDGSWRAKSFGKIEGTASENGTFWGSFEIPEDMEPGTYTIKYRRNGSSDYDTENCRIQVQFFERLRFESHASIPQIVYYSGDTLDAEVSANYLGGGSMAGAYVWSTWSREPVGFGAKSLEFRDYRYGPLQGYDGRTSLGESEGILSSEGRTNCSQTTGGEKLSGMAYSYSIQAQITDEGNQMISTSTSAVVHPAKFYIGVSSAKGVRGFPKKGDTLKFDYVCLTPDENAPLEKDLPQGEKKKLRVELLREEWKEVQQVGWNGQINTRYVREMVEEENKLLPLSGSSKPSEIQIVPPKGGAYLLRLSTTDSRENKIITETRFYATGSDWYWFNREDAEQITMSCDKDTYSVGDTAHILVQSPLAKGTYMLTLEREGLKSQRLLSINEPTTVIDVDIEEDFVPVMYATLSSYTKRTADPSPDFDTPDLGKPKGLFGLTALHVSTDSRRFNIKITQSKPSFRPGEEAQLTVHAEKDGMPLANAEITLMAVDRGVVDLIDYHVADPVAYFYREGLFPLCVKGGDSRSLLMDPVTYEVKNLVGGDSLDGSDKLNERKNFEPTALFVPSLMTDAEGNATCTFTLPDTLTAYRISAVGVTKNTFALSEDEMNVAEPVSVRHVLPRKLRVDDLGEVGVTLSNLDSASHDVEVTLDLFEGLEKTGIVQGEDEVVKLPGKAEVSGSQKKNLSVKADSTSALMFSLKARAAGWITVQFTVRSDVVNEKIILPLEVEKPYIYETVTTVGEVSSDKAKGEASSVEKLVLPSNADDGKGSLYFQLDSTRLGVLHEAVDYVFHYPYGCMEQRSSRVLPLVAFGEYIKVLGMENEVKNPRAIARKEILSWNKAQHSDGGFGYWQDSSISSLTVSARIGEIIAIAVEKKIITRSDIKRYDALVNYLVRNASEYSNERDESFYTNYIRSYLYYVISCLGGPVADSDVASIAESKKSDLDTLSFCALTYLNKHKNSKAQEIAEKIRRSTKYSVRGIDLVSANGSFGYWSFLNDESENLALALTVFTRLKPDDDINQHLVYELLSLQRAGKGYWKSTAVTARVLIALDSYIREEKLEDTDLSAQALLGETQVLSGKFKGVAAESAETTLDFASEDVKDLPRGKEIPVTFKKDGTGKVFYTLSMKYALPVLEQNARDEGISVFTEIVDIKTGEVVKEANLVSGRVYRERVFVSTTRDRTFVALRVPVPCGTEIMNAAFVTTGSFAERESEQGDEDYGSEWHSYGSYSYGLSNQQIYDSEVHYFWNMFPRGSQKVEFLFRASRSGEYTTPSATAECMYEPEVFGRTSGRIWKIN